jgi:hypothetical protein
MQGVLPPEVTLEVFNRDGQSKTFSSIVKMPHPMKSHTCTPLPPGSINDVLLLTGGGHAFLFDLGDPGNPFTSVNTHNGAPLVTRFDHTATQLKSEDNRNILIVGGVDQMNGSHVLQSADRYDQVSNTITPVSDMNYARTFHTATLLRNRKVLIAGGIGNNGVLNNAELFDPTTNTFTEIAATMSEPRFMHTATLLLSGKVLLVGGQKDAGDVSSAELYDPDTNSFTPTGSLVGGPRSGHTASLINLNDFFGDPAA